ncbi:MAG: exodeoxyribonuclease VII small subunit [Candidatus Thermofonsia Clade 1 bacterium]|jgi:exodeoxyribonuclease VII small subunit|uniref:Exodeoxyribonuclease 7 small subunit n=1 Tax=Candidatus Thermofonsia Clade 1 bacterium TaxID=2364210 RepID=A0A2M8PGZ0_9CHLR|nr:MAG: exodeoxyribonuclease VII small subunit [Candidatus Thermofonsia Clade 1 bacterium]RMF51229.1 MAG: exodeoxyribonuclease VII small subunit [Chloroflexota bacterium]
MNELPAIQSFEEAYQRLSQIVNQLERGVLSLDESLALYERGRALLAFCQQKLDSAVLRVHKVDSADAPDDFEDEFDPSDPEALPF